MTSSTSIACMHKRVRHGRMYEVMKKLRLSTHEHGDFCNCRKFQCTEKVSIEERKKVLKQFNELDSHDKQNDYLASLISLTNIKHKKPTKLVRPNQCTYKYYVMVEKKIEVCCVFFKAVHGITKSKLEFIQNGLKTTGAAPKDKRGGYKSRKLSFSHVLRIRNHIRSFSEVSCSSCSLHVSLEGPVVIRKPMSIKSMHKAYQQLYPDDTLSYQTYREIMRRDLNVVFKEKVNEGSTTQFPDLFGNHATDVNKNTKAV